MNFNLTNTTGAASTHIKAYEISKVIFDGIELKNGTSQNGREWKALQLSFKGDTGTFEPMFFCPGEDGDKRMSGETDGRKWEVPSAMEDLMHNVAHFMHVIAPENFEKIRGKISLELPKEFDKLVEILKKATEKSIGKEFFIKTVANSQGFANLPRVVKINSNSGESFLGSNWISVDGKNLSFTPNELKKKAAFAAMKPSSMKDDKDNEDDLEEDTTSATEELTLDDL